MEVKKDILNSVIIDNRTDLVSHLCCSILDIKELHLVSRKVLRRVRVVNIYDKKVSRGQVWEGSSPIVRRAIQDVSWRHYLGSSINIRRYVLECDGTPVAAYICVGTSVLIKHVNRLNIVPHFIENKIKQKTIKPIHIRSI